jgi:hypothetical protein
MKIPQEYWHLNFSPESIDLCFIGRSPDLLQLWAAFPSRIKPEQWRWFVAQSSIEAYSCGDSFRICTGFPFKANVRIEHPLPNNRRNYIKLLLNQFLFFQKIRKDEMNETLSDVRFNVNILN